MDFAAQVDRERKPWVDRLDHVAQHLRALKLVVLQPLFQELVPALLDHWTAQLNRFESVELARRVFEQNGEILQERRLLASGDWGLLEPLERLLVPEHRLRGAGGNLCGFGKVASLVKLIKFRDENLIATSQVVPDCHTERELWVTERGVDVRDDCGLVHRDRKQLTFPVDAHDAGGRRVRRGDQDGLGGESVHADASPRFNIVQVNVAVLCKQVNDVKLWGGLHCDREIGGGFRREVDVDRLFREGVAARLDLNDVKLAYGRRPNTNAEQGRFLCVARDLELSKRRRVAFHWLGNTFVYRVELHLADYPVVLCGNAGQEQPFA